MPTALDHYRLLGRSGLRVSPLALGTMTFGVGSGSWGSSEAEALAMLDMFIERGGNFIDTANFYGQMGSSEEWLGRLVKGRREPLVISTKYSLTTRPGDPNSALDHGGNWYSVQCHPEATVDLFATVYAGRDPGKLANYRPLPFTERMLLNFLTGTGVLAREAVAA